MFVQDVWDEVGGYRQKLHEGQIVVELAQV